MCKKSVLYILVLLVLSLAGSIAAQHAPPSPEQMPGRAGMGGGPPVLGTITSVGVDRFEIKTSAGTAQTVLVNDQTHFRQWEQPGQPQEIKLEDLKVGDHLIVRGTSNADKPMLAAAVHRITADQFQTYQSTGGPGSIQRPPGEGTWGHGNRGMGPHGGGQMAGNRVGGEILSIDGNEIKVRGRQGERTIVVSDQTTLAKGGQAITLKDLQVGDHIAAWGKETGGKFAASVVRTFHPAPGGGPEGSQSPQSPPAPQTPQNPPNPN